MNELTLAAPAKINLYLHSTGKRADGYHLLDTALRCTRPLPGLMTRSTSPYGRHGCCKTTLRKLAAPIFGSKSAFQAVQV
jgi:hypothetical protein